MKPIRALSAVLGLALAWPALAQDSTLPPAERQAFELKGSGQTAAARDAFLELAGNREGASPRDAALAEFYAAVAGNLTGRTGAARLAEEFVQLAGSPMAQQYPRLRDRLLLSALGLAGAKGDTSTAVSISRELGCLSRWWIIGPFDNERGAGFKRADEPEKGFDPEGSYDGKKREVQWRQLPVAEPRGGIVDLDAMVRPNDQVMCYAAMALVADSERSVALHLGSDESFKVLLNGAEVAARDVHRPWQPDQDIVVLDLHAGANLLLLKICDGEGAFQFSARLRELDGSPVEGVRESNSSDDLVAASAVQARPASGAELAPTALDTFLAGAEAGSAVDAFRAAILLLLSSPDDQAARRDQELAAQAVAGLPDFSAALYLRASARVQTGRAEEKDENQRRRDYEQVLAMDPANAEALTSLGEMAINDIGAAERAEALARRALEIAPGYTEARRLLARALDRQQLQQLADEEYRLAAAPDERGDRDPQALRIQINRMLRRGEWQAAEAEARDLIARSFTWSSAQMLAACLAQRGARDELLTLLDDAERAHPFAKGPRARLAGMFAAGDDAAGALTALQRWLEICPEDDDALVQAAEVYGLLGENERQIELLRQATELNPNRKEELRLLEFLESGAAPFHAKYELDADAVIAADPGPPADSAEANDSHHWILKQKVVRAYRNGTTSEYRHDIVKLLTDRATRDFARYSVSDYYRGQRARILSLRIIKADGSEQRPTLRGARAQLPPLQPGDIIDVRSRVDDTAPSFFGDYFGFIHQFTPADGTPIGRADLALVLDPGRDYRFQALHGVPEAEVATTDDGLLVHKYSMSGLPRDIREERQPAAKEYAPLVRVSTYRDWNHFASWYSNLLRKQIRVSPEMSAKVAELIEGRDDEMAQITAIYNFVTTEVRYKAWEFGVHGYKPYSTDVIFERRHGDCKDKGLLITAMLSEIGVEAYPVLIWGANRGPRSVDDLSLAMVQHFNHFISYLPATDDREAMFLDGTAIWHPADILPDMDYGAKVLVVTPDAGELHEIPYPTADANVDAKELIVSLMPNGNATAKVTLEPALNQAVGLREYMGNEPAEREKNLVRVFDRTYGKSKLNSLELNDPLDMEAPVRVQAEFEVSTLAASEGGGLALKPVFNPSPMQRNTAATERIHPLLLGTPNSEHTVIHYRLPDGWAPVSLPDPVKIESPFGAFELNWTFADGEVSVERRRVLRSPRIEPAEYPEFREFASQVDAAEAHTVIARENNQ